VENLEHQAAVLFGEKEYKKALEIYLLLHQGNPKTEKYAVLCGNCYDAIGEKQKAMDYYSNALKINRNSETAIINLSTINYELGSYDKSAHYARNVLKINPQNISAWMNLANIAFCNGNYNEALADYQKIYEYNSNSYLAMINIANTYFLLNKYVMALEFAKKSLNKHPSSIAGHVISGNSLAAMGKYEKAVDMFLKAYELDATNTEVLNALSDAYRSLNDWDNCVLFGWKYIKNLPEPTPSAFLNFGYLLYECYSEDNQDLAKKFAAKWLKRFPDNKITSHLASAILNGKALNESNSEFIVETFDAFAPDFEETLSGLEYQAPMLIDNALSVYLKSSVFTKYHIMDLGCGTGLCGEQIRRFASRKGLIGVDLSPKMLAEAEKKKIYAQLVCDDICHYMETSDYLFHVITAADVLTYFGDLTKVFVRVSKSLTPDGLFAFTVSENNLSKDDFFMAPSGRFLHSPEYVERVLKSVGLNPIYTERRVLRNEAEIPVYGYVIVARKPAPIRQSA
jgi:predicted TPR repeat methyltransferase